jgi:TPR repeat protein
MTAFIPSLLLAASAALLLPACTERPSTATGSSKAAAARPRGTKMVEYRAALDAYVGGRYDVALVHFRAAAELGHVNAQYYTGLMYANGEGTERNFDEAAKWYQQAAKHNQPDALFQLARLYAIGTGVKMDVQKAVELFDRAARVLPPGEKRDQAIQQKDALAAIVVARQAPAAAPAR